MNNKVIFLALGSIFFLSIPALYYAMHGSYERYLWFIETFPYIGGAPNQVMLFGFLFLVGLLMFGVSFFVKVNAKE